MGAEVFSRPRPSGAYRGQQKRTTGVKFGDRCSSGLSYTPAVRPFYERSTHCSIGLASWSTHTNTPTGAKKRPFLVGRASHERLDDTDQLP